MRKILETNDTRLTLFDSGLSNMETKIDLGNGEYLEILEQLDYDLYIPGYEIITFIREDVWINSY